MKLNFKEWNIILGALERVERNTADEVRWLQDYNTDENSQQLPDTDEIKEQRAKLESIQLIRHKIENVAF